MGRQYKCKSCGVVHGPPTGKHCTYVQEYQQEEQEEAPTNAAAQAATAIQSPEQVQTLSVLLNIQTRLSDIEQKMQAKDEEVANGATPSPEPSVCESTSPQPQDGARFGELEQASPDILRSDRALMREANRRLANLRQEEIDDEDGPLGLFGSRLAGKKSGSIMSAADIVVKRVDWPHFYVHRVAGSNGKPLHFKDLTMGEFVYGFLCMIEAPNCSIDYRLMTRLLKHVMQDSVDFSWESARNFYDMVGIAVEKGRLKWTDEDIIDKMRMQYARTIFPTKRETKDTPRPVLQTAPAGMKCCVPFQRRECEQTKDHHPFTHACAYCFKAKTALCRHPEGDCYRKANDLAKNGQARE